MQIIIALETKNKEGSDFFYLKAIRERFYYDRGNKITPVFMNGKGNYRNIEKKVNSYIKDYSNYGGESIVIYFVDVDSNLVQGDQCQLNKDIEKYCSTHNIKLVWFKKDIEHVMLGERVDNKLKTQKAKTFFVKKEIYKLSVDSLNKNVYELKNKESNVLRVLDNFLERRE